MSQQYTLEQQVQVLQEENLELRDQLARIEQRSEAAREARVRLMRGGWRILIPLLDRQKVVRSFGKLAETASDFAGPPSQWPARDQVLADAREFLSSCVRFVVRRRMVLLLFSIVAATIPAIQLWLVIQQNEIIENQNAFFEIQVYDIVARSMTEGDRNARQMTGALLANAEPEFLQGVVAEAFDPHLQGVYRRASLEAVKRRLEDAAFRGYLIRAVAHGVEQRWRKGGADIDELYAQARPMFRQILQDATFRIPEVLRLGRQPGEIDDTVLEQVDNYMLQVGEFLRVYGRLARSAEQERAFFADIQPLLERLAGARDVGQNQFAMAYRVAMQELMFDLGLAPGLGAPPVDLEASKTSPEQAFQRGMERLRKGVGAEALDWKRLEEQVKL